MSRKYYQVEKIVDKKTDDEGTKYLIKWADWPEEDSTWEPIEHLGNVIEMLDEFEKKILKKKAERNGVKKKIITQDSQAKLKKKKVLDDSDDDEDEKKCHDSETYSQFSQSLSLNEDEPKKEKENQCGKIECDIPQKIVTAKMSSDKIIRCLIEWRIRYNQEKPKESWVESTVMKKLYPEMLIDYYESKLQVKKNH